MNLPFLRVRRVLTVLVALLAAGAAQAAYVLTEFSRPGALTTQLWDVNNSVAMVGYSTSGVAPPDGASAFVFSGGTFTSLSGPAGTLSSYALGISDGGTVVGTYINTTAVDALGNVELGAFRGYIFQGGVYAEYDVAGAFETVLRGISPDGRYITGYYGNGSTGRRIGFVLDTVSNVRTDVSRADSLFTIAQGVNDQGKVVGSDVIAGAPASRPGFIVDPITGIRTDGMLAGAQRTAIRAITFDDELAGWYIDQLGALRGFVGSLSQFEAIKFAGAEQTFVEGINDARTLVGNYSIGDAQRAFVAQRVPEPASWALALGGLAALGWARRRR